MVASYCYACLILFAVASLFTATEAQQAASQCNTTAVDECLRRFANVSSLLSYTVNGSDLAANCKSYMDEVNCVDTLTGCKNEDRYIIINWLGAKNSYGHICGAGSADYQRHQRCLSNNSYSSLEGSCPDVTAYRNPLQYSLSADATCRQYTEALRCKKWAAEAACGREAAEFVGKVYTLYIDPPAKNIAPTCTGKCNGTALDECIKDFRPYSDRFFKSSLNATELDIACTLQTNASDCVRQRTGCTDDDTMTQVRWLGLRKTYEYMCGEGKTDYIQNRECLSNTTSSRDTCAKATVPANPNQACQLVQEQMTCLRNVTERACGKGALAYITGAASRYLAPAVQASNPICNVLGMGSSSAAMISSTLVLLTSLLLSIRV